MDKMEILRRVMEGVTEFISMELRVQLSPGSLAALVVIGVFLAILYKRYARR